MWWRKYNVIAHHKRTKEDFIIFTGSQNACIEKIFHLLAAQMDKPKAEINGEIVGDFKFRIERKKKK